MAPEAQKIAQRAGEEQMTFKSVEPTRDRVWNVNFQAAAALDIVLRKTETPAEKALADTLMNPSIVKGMKIGMSSSGAMAVSEKIVTPRDGKVAKESDVSYLSIILPANKKETYVSLSNSEDAAIISINKRMIKTSV
ncbi:MAG: hypothetical protein NTV88_05915 [Candidatus Micrarchaeota archaeon]|nr:hypothetical protein [Candidatus Micrarchaeota archaeon]